MSVEHWRGITMSRRLRLLAVALFAFYSTSVMAVGLGELELESALN